MASRDFMFDTNISALKYSIKNNGRNLLLLWSLFIEDINDYNNYYDTLTDTDRQMVRDTYNIIVNLAKEYAPNLELPVIKS